MDIARIQREIRDAQTYFEYVEAQATPSGGLMALVALQTSLRMYTLGISFPMAYPHEMPHVVIRKPAYVSSKHMYPNNRICYLHPHMWNPGRHDLTFVIQRVAKWLAKYEIYRDKGRWPGAEMEH